MIEEDTIGLIPESAIYFFIYFYTLVYLIHQTPSVFMAEPGLFLHDVEKHEKIVVFIYNEKSNANK